MCQLLYKARANADPEKNMYKNQRIVHFPPILCLGSFFFTILTLPNHPNTQKNTTVQYHFPPLVQHTKMATTTLFSMLSNLVYSFVLMQAEILAYLRPAQFLVGRLLKKNRAHVIFTVRFPASAPVFAADAPHPEKHAGAVLQILKGIGKQNPNFHLVKAVVLKDGETGRFEAWHLSNTLKWVDVVEMTLLPTASKYGKLCVLHVCIDRLCCPILSLLVRKIDGAGG